MADAKVTIKTDVQDLTTDCETPTTSNSHRTSGERDYFEATAINWETDPENPLNWPTWKKVHLVIMLSSMAFVATIAISIITPARQQLMDEFGIGSSVATLSMSTYVFALGFGPVVGGPMSETLGRLPVYQVTFPLGGIFTLGAGLAHNFGVLCLLRFAAGFLWAPALAIIFGSAAETFVAEARGPIMAILVLVPFLAPAFGPLIGSYAVERKDWRWTQWILLFFAAFCIVFIFTAKETFPPVLKHRLAKKRGNTLDPRPPLVSRIHAFTTIALIRPICMLFTEPIVAFLCLYVSVNFAILFSFLDVVPYTFGRVYGFSLEESGLVFLSIAIGSILGFATILLCEAVLYRRQIANYPPQKVPPEYRLYPAMVGSIGLPIGIFWYAWTMRSDVSWLSLASAIIPFAWGNLCVFSSTTQYLADTYHGNVVASATSANSLARCVVAGSVPLFIMHVYKKLGTQWATSLIGLCTVALLPIPWVLFKFGPRIRAKSKYETVKYE